MAKNESLERLCKLIRHDILTSTTAAGSGHPSSSLSAVELMTTLFFGDFLHFNLQDPRSLSNDRVIFSKGHASPLLYSLYKAAGAITDAELMSLRKFGSVLEGHPTPRFKFVDVATGSLGQGLSVGVGMALGIKLKMKNALSDVRQAKLKIAGAPKVWVLLGDSEIDEGQVWEAIESAVRYKLGNLIGILDVNRIGQYGETDEGWNLEKYRKKFEAFGWNTVIIKNGHHLEEIHSSYLKITKESVAPEKPTMIIAKTIKGKGISFLENKDGWHGKVLTNEQLKSALRELGKTEPKPAGMIKAPLIQSSHPGAQSENLKLINLLSKLEKKIEVQTGEQKKEISTREAYGNELLEIGRKNQDLVVLDAGVANSTYENKFQKNFPERFFELSISEENMLSVAVGLSKIGFIPFLSTFAAFLTQTFDQIRMAQYSDANLKIVGSHAGVSIGQDGPSQMGLEDLAMMRSILESVVFYPSDGVSTGKLTKIMEENQGIFYLRTTRGNTPIIYDEKEEFRIGGSKVHDSKNKNEEVKKAGRVLVISAGITLHEALKARQKLSKERIDIAVIDCYSVKPLASETLNKYITDYQNVIVVEDHYPYGGLGEAVANLITNNKLQTKNFTHLCVRKLPKSGTPEELLEFEEIDAKAIGKKIREMVKV